MHAGEVDIDAGLVRRPLASQFPRRAHLAIERFPSPGTVNAIYRLGEDMYVRMPRVDAWAADLRQERKWLPKLAPHLPLAVPEPLADGRPEAGYPFDWAVDRWLPGHPWAADRVDDERQAAVDLAGFVAALRAVDPTGAPPSWRGRLHARDESTRPVIASLADTFDADAVAAAWEASLQVPAWDGDPVWVHGDLLPPNLLVDGGRLSAVLDFGGVGVGDPACDVITAWSALSGGTRGDFREALGVDEQTWVRARGWALLVAVHIIPYYATNPPFVAMATRMVEEVVSDYSAGL